MSAAQPVDYSTHPIDAFTLRELTDALGVEMSAKVLSTSRRAIYTIRNTNTVSLERLLTLIEAVKVDEAESRRRLILRQRLRADRAAGKVEA